MACSIAENEPLVALRKHLSLSDSCHSFRTNCLQGHPQRSGELAMGIPGAVLGYCQALFARSGPPGAHTARVKDLLLEVRAPWARSHELFWGYRRGEQPGDFIHAAMQPLLGTGRVPIVITALDPAQDEDEIRGLLTSEPPVFPGETVLVRMVLGSERSIDAASRWTRHLVAQAEADGRLPRWWPLFQGHLPATAWKAFKNASGPTWRFSNVAVNPFTPDDVLDVVREQVVVGQVVLGRADGVRSDGRMEIPSSMKVSGSAGRTGYDLPGFLQRLAELPSTPTLIVLGPSEQDWSDGYNQERIARLIPLLRNGCDELWAHLPASRRTAVWAMSA
jgi:hypothetical protein